MLKFLLLILGMVFMTIQIELTQGQITVVDDIDADLANFKWYARWSKSTRSYYARRNIRVGLKRTAQHTHRVILSRILGRELLRSEQVDHINHDTLDNRRENLRLASFSQNAMNRNKQQRNTSGYKGVSWINRCNKWLARIKVNNKSIHLGYFDDPETAYEAYCKAADHYHGEFKNYE